MHLISTRTLLIIAVFCIAFANNAAGEGRVIAQAYEVLLEHFQAAPSVPGTITIRECAECDVLRFRITSATRYAVNGRPMQLEEFRLFLNQSTNTNDGSITVLHHLESDRVESIDAWL
jgi:hypothetical protein